MAIAHSEQELKYEIVKLCSFTNVQMYRCTTVMYGCKIAQMNKCTLMYKGIN